MRHFALYYKTVNIRIKYTKVVNFCFLPPPRLQIYVNTVKNSPFIRLISLMDIQREARETKLSRASLSKTLPMAYSVISI